MGQAAVAVDQAVRFPLPLRAGPAGRHVVDVTMLFAPTSGGIRRYLLAKHRWLRRHTRIKHTILVPGAVDTGLPYDLMHFASPVLPMGGGYRVPIRMRALRERLARLTPDLIEVGDPYHVAWQALRVAHQRKVPTVAFCHSDVITLAGSLLGVTGRRAASRYMSRLYGGFDLVLAPSASVAARLTSAGVCNVAVQPLGVDTETATPQARDPGLRAETFRPRNPRDLVLAVDRLFERDRAAIGRAARLRAEAHSWDAAFTQLIGRYWRLMAAAGPEVREKRHACG